MKKFLYLTNHHAIKTYGGAEVHLHAALFNLGTRWKCVVSFTPRPLYTWGKRPN